MKKLLIVESPTKAKTISRMLNADYTILASMGHIRDLPEHSFGVDLKNNFTPQYVDSPRSTRIVKELLSAAQKADEIYLAPDPDREGEAIAWHLEEVLKKSASAPFYRVSFHEITRSAIENALTHRDKVNLALVDAQQARRVLDRIVGYQVSPLLWSCIEKGISAGRVQSVAVRLVVERERAILAFVPEEYWNFALQCSGTDGKEFTTRLFKINGKDFRIADQNGANALLQAVQNGSAPVVSNVAFSERKRHALPPFTTSTMQQAASSRHRFSASDTMRYAQQLYEGVELGSAGSVGLITYMRTDSVNIAREAQNAARDFIRKEYGEAYAPEKPNFYRSKAAAQEAHEAIRPTDVTRTPESVAAFLEPHLLKLYTLIWRRFVASQMSVCVQHLTTVDVGVSGADGNDYDFRATATVTHFPGFTVVYSDDARNEDDSMAEVLGALQKDQILRAEKWESEQKFTEPPPRYTEASLIRELEENGIGRPSTYATILKTIQQRKYVTRSQGKLIPSELGFRVVDFLVKELPELFDVGFTALMEEKLDRIEEGNLEWTAMMQEFYSQFAPWLERAKLSDAPETQDAKGLLEALGKVTFVQPEKKKGKRTFDDGKFYRSVKEKFEKDGAITARQFQALLSIAARYQDQMQANAFSDEVTDGIRKAADAAAERESRKAASAAGEDQMAQYRRLFDLLDKVAWDAPVTRRGRVYDDGKFVRSLQEQALGGKILSERQITALGKVVAKYREQMPDQEFLAEVFHWNPAADTEENRDKAGEVANMLELLSKVTTWAEPVKRGRITYDDKNFYESIGKQHQQGKNLSDRQVAALKKLAIKYGCLPDEEA